MLKNLYESVNKFLEKSRFSGIIIAILSFLIVFLFSHSETYEVFESKLYDIRFQLKPSIKEWDRLTFIDIDENSLISIGEFPWPRDRYAVGIGVMKEVGVSQIALDIMFPDPSPVRVNDKQLQSLVAKARRGMGISAKEVKSIAVDMDSIFADSISQMNDVVLSYTFSPDPLSRDALKRRNNKEFLKARKRFVELASIPIPGDKVKDFERIRDKGVISYPIPELMNSARLFGFVNRYTDVDGVIRKVRVVRMHEDRLYFNLALAMYFDICKVKKENIEVILGEKILLKQAVNPDTKITEDISIPIDEEGMLFVNWAGPGPREKSFELMPFFSLIDYNDFVTDVYELFNEMDRDSGSEKRIEMMRNLDDAFDEYNEADEKSKPQKWAKIKGFRRDIGKINRGYLKIYSDDIKKVEEKIKSGKNPDLKRELETLQGMHSAIELVINVEDLFGKMVLTGLTATGTHDIGIIPLSKEYARVGTYHNTVNTIFNGEFISKSGNMINYIVMFLVAVGIGFVIQRQSARLSIITIVVSFILINGVIILLFSFFSIWVQQLGISLSLLLPSMVITAVKYLGEESKKKFIKNAFSHYLTPSVIEEIIKNPESLELGGENREITIFFSDVEGFSSISEKLTPPELVVRLNEYLSEMTDIILSYNGTVDKYEGDAIMAFYGAPHFFEDHHLKACLAAIDMKKRLRELQEDWEKRGIDSLKARMGMNTGDAVVGNMGSKTRLDYTAMGDSVNLASRLEGANKHYSTYSMVSETTYEGAKEGIEVRKLDVIRVVGKEQPVKIFELLGKKGALPDRMYDMIDKYLQGIELFENREWKKAKTFFHQALKVIPDDGPSKTYVNRCLEFMKNPPTKNWDGVFKLRTK